MTTTDKVNKLLLTITKTELSQELGISRPTLDSRLEGKSKWKKLEEKWITQLVNKR